MNRRALIRGIVIVQFILIFGIGFSSSLWQSSENPKFRNLYSDMKAYKIGDILTILIMESSSFEQRDDHSDRKGGLITQTFSIIRNISNIDLNRFIPTSGDPEIPNPTVSTDNTARSQVTARVAGRINDIDANGNLLIEGRREIKVGNDLREIVVQGVVRPADISSDNTVESYRIADARIWYNGEIVFQQDPREQSWLGYILSGIAGVIF